MMGPPPQGLAQLPPGPPGMGAPPPDPVEALSTAAAGMQQQQAQLQAGATGAMMALAQILGQQASPEAEAAQTSPGPMLPPSAGAPGPAGY
jgi:outer membrane protein TolC